MKCPKCSYVSHDYLDSCRKCQRNLAVFKQQIGLFVLQPGVLDLSVVLGSRANGDAFASRAAETAVQTSDTDFDISLDDYADRPMMRRASGSFVRPGTQEETGRLQHLTLQLDASGMSTELPRNIVRPAASASGTHTVERVGPPPLPVSALAAGAAASLPPGHLTLELESGDMRLDLPSGAFPQPPGLPNTTSTQPLPPTRVVRPDQETTENRLQENTTLDMDMPLPSAHTAAASRPSGFMMPSASFDLADSVDAAIPLLDSTIDETDALQLGDDLVLPEPVVQSPVAEQTEETALTMPTIEILTTQGAPIDVDEGTMPPAHRTGQVPRREPSTDSLDLGVPEESVDDEVLTFELAEPLGAADATAPGPQEILPTGSMPRPSFESTDDGPRVHEANSSFELGDALRELTASDFEESDLEFEFQEVEASAITTDEVPLVDDNNPFDFDLNSITMAAESVRSVEGTQHESKPGHLTLELDEGAMSLELSATVADTSDSVDTLEPDRRSMQIRLEAEALTDTPASDVVFTSLEDTFELEDQPQKSTDTGHLTLELDARMIQRQAPVTPPTPDEPGVVMSETPPQASRRNVQLPDDGDELLLDLDDIDEGPKKS